MDCKKCQYHTVDGRCLYYIGCPYKQFSNEPTEDDLLEFEAEAFTFSVADPVLVTGQKTNADRIRSKKDEEVDNGT